MSERWGDQILCRHCGSTGEITFIDPITNDSISMVCRWCDGSIQYTGGAMEQPEYVRNHEAEMREAIQAAEEFDRGRYRGRYR